MEIQFFKHEKMLFELLRAAIHEETANPALFEGCTIKDWEACKKMAVIHGVMALAWDGLLTLPSDLLPPKSIKIMWGIAVEKYEQRYRYYCETAEKLSSFYASHGIATLILKGVGLSTCYPIPSHREGGDIDIFTYSADVHKMSHEEANNLANTLISDQGIDVDYENKKHSKFNYHNIPIENHSTFLDVALLGLAKRMEPILHQKINPQRVGLLNNEYTILSPSTEFNLLFVSFHALQHCTNELCLHHLCDWACLIKRYGLTSIQTINEPTFQKAIEALTQCTNQLLGTNAAVQTLDTQLKDILLFEIFRSEFHDINFPTRKLNILWYKARRFIHFMHLKKHVFNEPYNNIIRESIVNHLLHPEIFFMK